MASSSALRKLVVCPGCDGIYNADDVPLILEQCGHTLCSKCCNNTLDVRDESGNALSGMVVVMVDGRAQMTSEDSGIGKLTCCLDCPECKRRSTFSVSLNDSHRLVVLTHILDTARGIRSVEEGEPRKEPQSTTAAICPRIPPQTRSMDMSMVPDRGLCSPAASEPQLHPQGVSPVGAMSSSGSLQSDRLRGGRGGGFPSQRYPAARRGGGRFDGRSFNRPEEVAEGEGQPITAVSEALQHVRNVPTTVLRRVLSYRAKTEIVCRYIYRGQCRYGDSCKFFHPPCRHFQRGRCTYGENCKFPHVEIGKSMVSSEGKPPGSSDVANQRRGVVGKKVQSGTPSSSSTLGEVTREEEEVDVSHDLGHAESHDLGHAESHDLGHAQSAGYRERVGETEESNGEVPSRGSDDVEKQGE